MPRKPRWSVTWPTRPCGVYTVPVRAADPTDAVRVAAEQELQTTPGYALAFDYEPQVWRVLRPYWLRSRPVAGPDYPDTVPGEVAFAPALLDPDEIAERAVSAVRIGDALGHSEGEIRATVGQILGLLTPDEVAEVLVRVTDETEEINRFSRGEATL